MRTHWMRRQWDRVVLATIIAGSMALAAVWVFRVPIYQSPDEPQHLDYAFCLSEISGLFRASEMPRQAPNYFVHPNTMYLQLRTSTPQVAFHHHVGMPRNYGTPEFFAELDRDAPPRRGIDIRDAPSLLVVYPYGYYWILGRWIAVVRSCGAGLTTQFFAARLLSVAMLGVTLLLTYASARRMPLGKIPSLFLTLVIAFLPLTSFIASYVQPDNLSFLLVSLSFFAAMLVRDRPADIGPAMLLGMALGMLLVTKVHFFLCVFLATMMMAVVTQRAVRVSLSRMFGLWTCLLTPSVVLGSIHLWCVWGSTNYFGPPAPAANFPWDLFIRLERAFADFYGFGSLVSFWGMFGWLDAPLIIRNEGTTSAIFVILRISTWGLIALTLLRLEQVATRLVRLARNGRAFAAVQMLVSNPIVNSYFLFLILMFILHIRLDNRFGGQGRNWIPFLLPIFYVPLTMAPKALTLPTSKAFVRWAVAIGLLAFVIAGSSYGLRSIRHRYYGRVRAPSILYEEPPLADDRERPST